MFWRSNNFFQSSDWVFAAGYPITSIEHESDCRADRPLALRLRSGWLPTGLRRRLPGIKKKNAIPQRRLRSALVGAHVRLGSVWLATARRTALDPGCQKMAVAPSHY